MSLSLTLRATVSLLVIVIRKSKNSSFLLKGRYCLKKKFNLNQLNLIWDGSRGRATCLPNSFSPVTSLKLETSPQNFHTFSLNPPAILPSNLKLMSSPSPKLLNLNQDQPF